jgi:response regulator RpfG family c-di-GMP phosphodiesterase
MKPKVLLVDDELNILSAYQRNLRSRFDLSTADSGENGLKALRESGPFSVVVSDYNMPIMDGIEFLRIVKEEAPDTIRIMLTGQADLQSAINAVNEGNIFRFLTKPCEHQYLINTLEAANEQYQLVTAEKVLLEKTLRGSIKVLIDILTIISPGSFSQSSRIRNLAKKIATRLKLPKQWEIEIASLLFQIGCITIPTEIVTKKFLGEELSQKENDLFLKHPSNGKNLLNNIPRLETIAEGIVYQFKNFDGTGYPVDTRKGEEIPLIGRILKLVRDYDNLILTQKPPKEAIEIMRKNVKFYDPLLFEALEAEVFLIAQGFYIKNIKLNELLPGMMLADDIKNENGITLIVKGFEMTDALIARLINYSVMCGIIEPVKILETQKNTQ